jgi:hypothetical protein
MQTNPKVKLCPVKAINASDGTIDFVLTSKTVDRDGEVILPTGGKLDNFRNNPVFLWAHSRKDPSIGRVIPETIQVTENEMTARVEFDLDDPFSALIFNKYQKKHLNAGSISFIPLDSDKPILDGQRGSTFTEWELLEFSGVPIPSNPQALAKEYPTVEDGTWFDRLKSFYENDNFDHDENGWCDFIEKSFDEDGATTDILTSVLSAYGESNKDDKSILSALIEEITGSFEWVQSQLTSAAPEWLIEYNSISGMREGSDMPVLVATFDNRAILCVVGMDRPFTEDPCFEAKWKMEEGVPAWKGQPRPVELDITVRRRMLDDLPVKKKLDNTPPEEKLAPIDQAWNKDQAIKNLVAEDRLWDSFAGEVKRGQEETDYLYLHHDIIEGEFVTVWRAVAEAMIELLRDDSLPYEEKEYLYEHLAHHYFQFGKKPPELVKPVEDSKNDTNVAVLETLSVYEDAIITEAVKLLTEDQDHGRYEERNPR